VPTNTRNAPALPPRVQPRGLGPYTASFLAFCEESYQRTGNPVFVWDALACVLSRELPVPDWIVPYWRDVAVGLSRLSRGATPRKRTIATRVAAIVLPRRGRTNPLDAPHQLAHEYLIAHQVYTAWATNRSNRREGLAGSMTGPIETLMDWTSIFTAVASSHVQTCDRCRRPLSAKTIERYWRKHALTIIPPNLLDRAIARARSRKLDDIFP
jgi:hypothetical protein